MHLNFRNDYFTSLMALLEYQREITELRAISDAFVPVIKMRFSGIEIDMTFARLNLPEVPENLDFLDDLNVASLDAKSVRSLNGYRSTLELLKLVPNKKAFQMTLRAIKLWAKNQGLYSNCLGYLGGFSWAVLVAKHCILNPAEGEPSMLVCKFFETFADWPWPKPVAVTNYEEKPITITLTGYMQTPTHYNGPGCSHVSGLLPPQDRQMLSWNAEKVPMDRLQVMPIITPTYPHLNSTFNVTISTLNLIQERMRSADALCKKILNGQEKWEALFRTQPILDEYNHFLVIRLLGMHHSVKWFGLIESRLRHFINTLEKDCGQVLKAARIWPKPLFKRRGENETERSEQIWLVGLEHHESPEEKSLDCAE